MRLFALLMVSALATSSAWARGVCEQDMNRHCLGLLQIGHKELNQCLMDHYDELSTGCQQSLPADAKARGRKLEPKKKGPESAEHESGAEQTEERAEH